MKPEKITNRRGEVASALALAAYPHQDSCCLRVAFEHGVNFFFFYNLAQEGFLRELAPLARDCRDSIIIATGSAERCGNSLESELSRILTRLETKYLDVFFAEYVCPADELNTIFGADGVLDVLRKWKRAGLIRFVGASTHDRDLAKRLVSDKRLDVLMHRFNMAHRRPATAVFPEAEKAKVPVIAFTATRWGTLLKGHRRWADAPPSAPDCYRYCLEHPAIQVVLSAPSTLAEMRENLKVLRATPMDNKDLAYWERYGDLLYGDGTDAFETQWP